MDTHGYLRGAGHCRRDHPSRRLVARDALWSAACGSAAFGFRDRGEQRPQKSKAALLHAALQSALLRGLARIHEILVTVTSSASVEEHTTLSVHTHSGGRQRSPLFHGEKIKAIAIRTGDDLLSGQWRAHRDAEAVDPAIAQCGHDLQRLLARLGSHQTRARTMLSNASLAGWAMTMVNESNHAISADELGVPQTFNLATYLVDRHWRGRADNLAIVCGDEEVTYR